MNSNQQSNHNTSDSSPNDNTQPMCGAARKAELEALIRSLERERDWFHILLDYSHDSIYFKDLDSKFLLVSRGHKALNFIDSPEEAIGKSDFDYFPVEHAQKAFEDEKRIIATGEPLLGIIERETAPGMPERWVFTSKLPIRNKDGIITGTFGISRDITQVKQYENELQRIKDKLEDRVRERTKELQSANKKLERRIDQLDFLTTASYEMTQHIGICDLGVAILHAFTSRLQISTAAILKYTDNRFSCIHSTGALADSAFKNVIEKAISQLNLPKIPTPKVIADWKTQFTEATPWADLTEISSCVIIPLLADNRTIGILLLFPSRNIERLLQEEHNVILTLAAQAAVCLSNAIYYQELDKKAHLEGELQAARSIQQRLTPDKKPDIPRVNLKGFYSPAYEVGGDYLDYFKNEAGYWVVFIADVCGKGIPAALLMTLLRSASRVEARFQTSAKQLLCAVNDSMQANLDDLSFITAACLIISPDGSTMTYARAGHPRMIRINPDNSVETLRSDGVALGVFSNRKTFESVVSELVIPLQKGQRYIVYTDGLTEAFNSEKSAYGLGRLNQLMGSMHDAKTPEAILDAILHDVNAFTAGAPANDDLTIIAMEVT